MSNLQAKIDRYYSIHALLTYDFLMQSIDTKQPTTFLMNALQFQKGQHVLEAAVGTGRNLKHYPHDVKITGVDNNRAMLLMARLRTPLFRDVSLVRENATRLSFDDNSFDRAVITYGLSAIPDNQQALREIARVVRPDGKIGIIDIDHHITDIVGGFAGICLEDLIYFNKGLYEVEERKTFQLDKWNEETQSAYILRVL